MDATPSAAAQILIAIIPTVGIVAGAVVIFFYLYWNNKQRMLLIEKNLIQKRSFDLVIFSILTGLILLGIGLSLTLFFFLKEGLSYSLLGGLIPLSIGISLIVFYMMYRKTRSDV